MDKILLGRENERSILEEAIQSNEAELVSVVGRRRVGKTFLVQSVYRDRILFSVSGLPGGNRDMQLGAFRFALTEVNGGERPKEPITDWLTAFFALARHFDKVQPREKFVIFFDELPWMATKKSGFIPAFSWLWNSWAVNKKVVIVICGSAASWMVQKIVRDRGGLHNRITRRITVKPFDLFTTRQFLLHKGVKSSYYSTVQLYMAMGGIPHYLKEVKPGLSAAQNIDAICFSPQGILFTEFNNLYAALFDDYKRHLEIVRFLASKPNGVSRQQLVDATELSSGGRLTKIIEELTISGFVAEFSELGRKFKRYRLIDEYSLFYLRFIEPMETIGRATWLSLSQTQAYKTWSGYAFESVGLRHVSQIKQALGISGVFARSAAFYHRGKDGVPGVQVDLVIDRDDHVVNLCEFKFYSELVTLTKAESQKLLVRKSSFRHFTGTRKQLFWTFVSPYGMSNSINHEYVDHSLTMEVLFEPS